MAIKLRVGFGGRRKKPVAGQGNLLEPVQTGQRGIVVFESGGEKLVSGLQWFKLSQPRFVKKEARSKAEELERVSKVEMSVVAIRRGADVLQGGFAPKSSGALRGMYSFATVAAAALEGPFIAAFPLANGRFAIVAVVGGAIIPGSDCVLPLEEARAKVEDLWTEYNDLVTSDRELRDRRTSGPLFPVYAPSEITKDGLPVGLDVLVPHLTVDHKLRPIQMLPQEELKRYAAFGILALVGLSTWGYYTHLQHQERLRREAAERAERERLAKLSQKPATKRALEHPWAKAPAAAQFAQRCVALLWSYPMTLGGWQLVSAQCTDQKVIATYGRLSGQTAQGFVDAANAWNESVSAAVGLDVSVGTVALPISFQPGGDDALVGLNQRTYALVSHFQRQDIPIRLQDLIVEDPNKKQLPGVSPNPREEWLPPDWRTRSWATDETDRSAGKFFAGIPGDGIRILTIGFKVVYGAKTGATIKWFANGEIYGS